jgi:hypothetical protein
MHCQYQYCNKERHRNYLYVQKGYLVARKKKQHKKNTNTQAKLKKHQSTFHHDVTMKTNALIGLFSHVTSPVLFTICLALALYFYEQNLISYVLWASFSSVFFVGLIVIFYLREHRILYTKNSRLIWFSFWMMVLICLGSVFYLQNKWIPETEIHGVLIPANDQSPPQPTNCIPSSSKDIISLYFGDSLAWVTQSALDIIRIKKDSLLSVNKEGHGIQISAKIFSEDRRIIAKIVNNEFYINPNNYFRRERPDKYTLIVYDQQDRMILYIRYLNSSAINNTLANYEKLTEG